MPRPYAVLDVFTDTPLEGNPLAAVLDAEGLDDSAMQAIVREFNLSETVFVLPADNPAHAAKLRIFTPGRELPFAGHPTVGMAVLLALRRFAGSLSDKVDAMVMLEEKIGPVRCAVDLRGPGHGFAAFDVPRIARPAAMRLGSREEIAAAIGIEPREVGFENHVPSAFEAGVPFAFVPVRDLSVIGTAAPMPAFWKPGFGEAAAYLYTRETLRHDSAFHARMFAPDLGIGEDPATGAAAAAFAGVVLAFDAPPAGLHRARLEQGFEMGRPSLIDLEMEIEGGALRRARIGGNAVVVAEGRLFV